MSAWAERLAADISPHEMWCLRSGTFLALSLYHRALDGYGCHLAVRGLEQPWVCVQLETVYVLEGLGPPKDHAAAGRTFADQVLT